MHNSDDSIKKLEARIQRQVHLLLTDPSRRRGTFERTVAIALLRDDVRTLKRLQEAS